MFVVTSVSYAIQSQFGRDFLKRDAFIGYLILALPNYGARIKNVKTNQTELVIEIESNELKLEELLGKLWCEGENGEITQKDLFFTNSRSKIQLNYMPKNICFYLLSRKKGEIVDYWQNFQRMYRKDVKTDLSTEELMELIKRGENQKVEFKSEDVKPDSLAKQIVAFANTNGGIILLGIDDEGNIKGVSSPERLEEKIRNIVANNCKPTPYIESNKYSLNEKVILAIFVLNGKHKPYQRVDGKFFIRRGSTSRPANPTELKELK